VDRPKLYFNHQHNLREEACFATGSRLVRDDDVYQINLYEQQGQLDNNQEKFFAKTLLFLRKSLRQLTLLC
jgi:hypothetical protein